ncbi:MAG: FmdB family zinc ribbon protein [Verrucomicrobiota bacterium]
MPIYIYEPVDGACEQCRGSFEFTQSMRDAPLTHCPHCNKPVKKCVAPVNVVDSFSPLAAKNAGFQVLKRRDKGVYEKL